MFSGILSDMKDDPRLEWEFMAPPPFIAKREAKPKKRKNFLRIIFDAIWRK